MAEWITNKKYSVLFIVHDIGINTEHEVSLNRTEMHAIQQI